MIWSLILVLLFPLTWTNKVDEKLLPTEERIDITWSLKGQTGVNITFQHVYPMPRCELLHNKNLISTTYRSDNHMIDIFYKNASISLINNSKICGGNIELRCTLMGLRMLVSRKHVLPACNDKHFEITTLSNTHEPVLVPLCIAVSGFVTTCIVAAVCLIRGKRKALLKPEHEENNQILLNSLPL
ncbi:uncharacterized protein LOC127732846 isoform X2 [Mytilus californianus]|uniref:uncharacterized protein LOC127732846 isoform X2 n=1 Tax=Mytilus californianus TaxID=6549 RepID=UPI00224645CA|nr:uncharacterized protein LOC127732846 isoform X2 [Mytilus californianus]